VLRSLCRDDMCSRCAERHAERVVHALKVTHQMVGKWRRRSVERRLPGLFDAPRPGEPRPIGDALIEEVPIRTVESTPPDATHWRTRSMAKASGLSQTMVSRIWRAFGLQPHRRGGSAASQHGESVLCVLMPSEMDAAQAERSKK